MSRIIVAMTCTLARLSGKATASGHTGQADARPDKHQQLRTQSVVMIGPKRIKGQAKDSVTRAKKG